MATLSPSLDLTAPVNSGVSLSVSPLKLGTAVGIQTSQTSGNAAPTLTEYWVTSSS